MLDAQGHREKRFATAKDTVPCVRDLVGVVGIQPLLTSGCRPRSSLHRQSRRRRARACRPSRRTARRESVPASRRTLARVPLASTQRTLSVPPKGRFHPHRNERVTDPGAARRRGFRESHARVERDSDQSPAHLQSRPLRCGAKLRRTLPVHSLQSRVSWWYPEIPRSSRGSGTCRTAHWGLAASRGAGGSAHVRRLCGRRVSFDRRDASAQGLLERLALTEENLALPLDSRDLRPEGYGKADRRHHLETRSRRASRCGRRRA